MKYEILAKDGRAKRARVETVHGVIETPVFMNVGTAAAIKGAVSTDDLRQIGTQVELSNTYHLHVRPVDNQEAVMALLVGVDGYRGEISFLNHASISRENGRQARYFSSCCNRYSSFCRSISFRNCSSVGR